MCVDRKKETLESNTDTDGETEKGKTEKRHNKKQNTRVPRTEQRMCSFICCTVMLNRPSMFLMSVSVCSSLRWSSSKVTYA